MTSSQRRLGRDPCSARSSVTGSTRRSPRRIITLADARKDGDHFFWPFGPDLMLRQVIVGPRSKVTKRLLKEVLGDDLKHVELTRSRLAFRTFRVVANLRGWKNRIFGGDARSRHMIDLRAPWRLPKSGRGPRKTLGLWANDVPTRSTGLRAARKPGWICAMRGRGNALPKEAGPERT